MEQLYNTAYERYERLLNQHNYELIQAISVTDDIAKEQYQESYLETQAKLQEAEAVCKSLEKDYIKFLADGWLEEFTTFYSKQFVSSTLDDELQKQGISLGSLTNELRMRPITSLEQKREMCILLNTIKRRLKIIDYMGIVVDYIGKAEDSNPLIIRCAGFANISHTTNVIKFKENL